VSCEELLDKAERNDVNLVFFGTPEGAEFDLYDEAANFPGVDAYNFFHTGAECAEAYHITAPGMAIIRKFDEPILPYKGEKKVDGVLSWMYVHE